jgi:CBS domain-containing protein
MSQPAITCHVNDPLNVAAQRMWDHDCGAIAVVNDEGHLTGMITDRDICMAALMQSRPLDELLVNAAMSKRVVAVRPQQALREVEELMAKHQIRRIPVIDEEDCLVGMISLNDLARESAQPDTRITQGLAKVAHTLAAICAHRSETARAA